MFKIFRERILPVLVLSFIGLLIPSFFEVRDLRADYNVLKRTTSLNDKLLCKIAIQVNVDKDFVEQVCLRKL